MYESRKARNAPYPPVYDFLNDFVCHHLDLARYFMGDVEYVYAELVSRTHDPDNLNARLFEHEDVFRNWAAVLRDNPHVPQADGRRVSLLIVDDPEPQLQGNARRIADREIWLSRARGFNIASWRNDEIVYSLISDLDEQDILALVQSAELH